MKKVGQLETTIILKKSQSTKLCYKTKLCKKKKKHSIKLFWGALHFVWTIEILVMALSWKFYFHCFIIYYLSQLIVIIFIGNGPVGFDCIKRGLSNDYLMCYVVLVEYVWMSGGGYPPVAHWSMCNRLNQQTSHALSLLHCNMKHQFMKHCPQTFAINHFSHTTIQCPLCQTWCVCLMWQS